MDELEHEWPAGDDTLPPREEVTTDNAINSMLVYIWSESQQGRKDERLEHTGLARGLAADLCHNPMRVSFSQQYSLDQIHIRQPAGAYPAPRLKKKKYYVMKRFLS
jgi:hypothetical protein